MNRTRITYLHQQYLKKVITIDEWAEFKQALASPEVEEVMGQVLDEKWNNISASEMSALDAGRFEKVYSDIVCQERPENHTFRLWYSITAAAVVLLIVGAGLIHFINSSRHHYLNDVLPGKMGATLTLSNGKRIKLTDSLHGELAEEAGVSISKKDDGQIVYEIKAGKHGASRKTNVLSTDQGETYVLILPDGSKVWLNAASSLTYATSFNESGARKVQLDGEAYFEVSKDKKHPFIVESKGQEVEVLGTHFNINAYLNEPAIKTTLIEGAVKVSSNFGNGNAERSALLQPEQQAIVDGTGIKVKPADIEAAMAWTNGKFIFRDEALVSIMRRVASWYGIEVDYVDDVSDLTYWGAVSRTTNISSVLDYFSKTGNVEFKVQGKKVTVIKK